LPIVNFKNFTQVSVELHREASEELKVYVMNKKREVVLRSTTVFGAGGQDSKHLLQGVIDAHTYYLVIESDGENIMENIVSDATTGETSSLETCLPVRLDVAVVPFSEAPNYWPMQCPRKNIEPPKNFSGGLLPGKSYMHILGVEFCGLISIKFGDDRCVSGKNKLELSFEFCIVISDKRNRTHNQNHI